MGHRTLFLFFLLIMALLAVGRRPVKILLKEVPVLTFAHDQMTQGRRSKPVPQLACIGGSAKSRPDLYPETVQCKNVGSDGLDVNWDCHAELESDVKFGKMRVSCEGYDHPDDPFVLAGSCGLEYELEFTKEGFERQREAQYVGANEVYIQHTPLSDETYDTRPYSDNRISTSNPFKTLLFLTVCAVSLVFLAAMCFRNGRVFRPAESPAGTDRAGGQGFPGGLYPPIPPPGVFPSAPPPPSSDCCSSAAGMGVIPPATIMGYPVVSVPTHQGFGWRSLLSAGLLGYLWGRGRQNRGEREREREDTYGPSTETVRHFHRPRVFSRPAAPPAPTVRRQERRSDPPISRVASGFATTVRR